MTIETQVDQQIALKKFRSEYVSYGFSVILVLKYRAWNRLIYAKITCARHK